MDKKANVDAVALMEIFNNFIVGKHVWTKQPQIDYEAIRAQHAEINRLEKFDSKQLLDTITI